MEHEELIEHINRRIGEASAMLMILRQPDGLRPDVVAVQRVEGTVALVSVPAHLKLHGWCITVLASEETAVELDKAIKEAIQHFIAGKYGETPTDITFDPGI